MGGIGQIELDEQFFGAALSVPSREVIQPPDHLQVFLTRQIFVDGHGLTRQADLRFDAIRVPDDIETRDGGTTGVGLEQGRENPDRRRLARPVRSQ